jgi:hypothetical protein
MNSVKFILLFVVLAMQVSCSCFQPDNHKFAHFVDLVSGSEGQGSPLWKGVYYCGFIESGSVACNVVESRKSFYIIKDEKSLAGVEAFPFTCDKRQWVLVNHICEPPKRSSPGELKKLFGLPPASGVTSGASGVLES